MKKSTALNLTGTGNVYQIRPTPSPRKREQVEVEWDTMVQLKPRVAGEIRFPSSRTNRKNFDTKALALVWIAKQKAKGK